jgi:hypothetical protein
MGVTMDHIFFYCRSFKSMSGDIEVGARLPRGWFRPLYALYRCMRRG